MEAGVTKAGSGSIISVGTAVKAFALAHPLGMAAAGGSLLGMGTYYAIGKVFKKKPKALPQQEAIPAT